MGGRVQSVEIRDLYVEDMYCARKWEPKILSSIAKELALLIQVEKSAEVDKFLIENGAEEFVWFMTVRSYLFKAYTRV